MTKEGACNCACCGNTPSRPNSAVAMTRLLRQELVLCTFNPAAVSERRRLEVRRSDSESRTISYWFLPVRATCIVPRWLYLGKPTCAAKAPPFQWALGSRTD